MKMKKIILSLLILLMSQVLAFSQPQAVNSIMDKYSGEEGFTSMTLNDAGPLLRKVQGDDKAKEALKSVKKLKILTFDGKKGKNLALGKEFAKQIKSASLANFNELMSMQEGSRYLKMFTKIDGKSTSEFIMFVTESESESSIIYLNGDFTLAQIRDVGNVLQKNRDSRK